MSFDCTNCNFIDLKMIKTFFRFIACVYLHFNFMPCLHMKNSIKFKEILVKYTHRKANGKKL